MINKLLLLIYIFAAWLLPADLNTYSSSGNEDIPFYLDPSQTKKVDAIFSGMTLLR